MGKKRKIIALLLLLTFILPANYLLAADGQEIHIEGRDTIIVGYWDEWLHSDGITWQDTDQDGDFPHHPPQEERRIFQVGIPTDLVEAYDNLRYEIIPFKREKDRDDNKIAANSTYNKALYDRADKVYNAQYKYEGTIVEEPETIRVQHDGKASGLVKFREEILRYIPYNYELLGGQTLRLYSGGYPYDIKRTWQNTLVEGRRFLLPAVLVFYGTPKAPAPPPTPKKPENLPCTEATSIANTWETVYSWEVEHSSSYTDPLTGETVDSSWTETVYETVGYYERLATTLTVNTKQGIPTNLNNPKDSDRESRGSWEIIPWSKKKGLNPNEVTRAGYGFEVKVQTTYTTDWETKVPGPASAKGGTYKGPDKVTADFYDTKGRFMTKVNMVPTQGRTGDRNITWELPQARYDSQAGNAIYERKHYTDVNIPDGTYQVRITISGAGKTDLCLIQRKNVTIYGDMYDDIYTRVSSQEE